MTKDKYRVWNKETKEMSEGMPLEALAGYLTAIYPNLGNEVYLQFTGLHDRNGREIYDGDSLKDGDMTVQVEWDTTNGRWYSIPGTQRGWRDCEVVGNIYE